MSIFEVTPYSPTKPWQPTDFTPEVLEAHADYSFYPSARNEERLARLVAQIARKLFDQNGSCGIYRAGPAIKKGVGDCRAFTEVTTGMLDALNLKSYVYWETDPGHASGLWIGQHDVWRVDGYAGRAFSVSFTDMISNDTAWKLEITIRQAASNGKGIYIHPQGDSLYHELTPLALSEADDPYQGSRHIICLPYLQGLAMLGAMGDLERYTSVDEGKWYTRRADVLSHLPKQYSEQ